MICEEAPCVIPDLRSLCRQLRDASFFAFLKTYFTEVTILAHASGIAVLDEIANDGRFNKAIRTLIIDPHGVFPERMSSSHDALIDTGIIRTQLAHVLAKLPNCRKLAVPRWDQMDFLGFTKIPAFVRRNRKTVYIDQDNAYWMSSKGFGYPSYVLCDVLHACITGTHVLETVELEMQMEFGPLCDYIEKKLTINARAERIKHFSIIIADKLWRGTDEATYRLIGGVNDEFAWRFSPVETFFCSFPGLIQLDLWSTMMDYPFFPLTLPRDLKKLAYGEDWAYEPHAWELIHALKSAQSLQSLDLGYVGFESVGQCKTFLEVVEQLPLLVYFEIRPRLSDEDEGLNTPKLCFRPCVNAKTEHVFITTDPTKDIPTWMRSVHVCTCGDARQSLVDSSTTDDESDPAESSGSDDDGDGDDNGASDRSDDSSEDGNESEAHTDAGESDSDLTDSQNVVSDYGSSDDKASLDYVYPAAPESQEVWRSAGVSRG